MGITLKIDASGLTAKLNKAKTDIALKMVNELNQFATFTVGDAKRLAPVDEGFLRNSISFNPATPEKPKVKIVVAANYGAYIEFGTRRFAAAYVASLPANWQAYAATFKGKTGAGMDDFILRIMEWVKRKGIGATYNIKTHRRDRIGRQTTAQTEEADAYAIALHILRNGIQPHPFLYPAVTKNLEILKQRLK